MKLALNDSGKFQNKGCGDRLVIFKSQMMELEKYNSYYSPVIEVDGKFYAMGQGIINTNVTKLEELHKVSTYYAITQMFDDLEFGEDIYLATGSPIQTFENADYKQEFIDYLKGDSKGIIEVKVDNKPYVFNLKDVLLLPEGCGVVQMYPEKFANKQVGVIDWGGLQVNCMIYDNGKPLKSTGFTRQLGGYIMEKGIINRLNSEGYNYQDNEMEYVISNPKPHEKDVVEFMTNKYFNDIVNECQMMNWNIKNLELFFTGGTSARLSKFIQSKGYEVSETAMEDNVRGYGKIAKVWLQKLLSQK